MEDEGGDQGFLYLCFLNGMVAIDMKKLVSGGRLESETSSPPDLSPLPVAVDKRIVFRHQQLPSGFGFCVDGSNLYVVGGQWVETDRRGFLKVIKSKEDDGISRTMFVADLSARTVKFSKLHVFEAGKTFTVVTKFDEKIYALASNFVCYVPWRKSPFPTFEVYDTTTPPPKSRSRSQSKSITRLQTPPFYDPNQHPRCITDYAVVGTTIFVVYHDTDFHFYDVNLGIWERCPPPNSLLESIIKHGLGRELCRGNFVLGCEDVLITVYGRELEAILFPPVGSDGPVLIQRLTEMREDISRMFEISGELGQGMVLSLEKDKMCAIFPCRRNKEHKFLVYIYIFQVSKLPPQRCTKRAKYANRITMDFLSITGLHKGFYYMDERGFDVPYVYGAFYVRDGKAISSKTYVRD